MHSHSGPTSLYQTPFADACLISDVRNETIRIGIVAGEITLVANANNTAIFEDAVLAERCLRDLKDQGRWAIREVPGRKPNVTWTNALSRPVGTEQEST